MDLLLNFTVRGKSMTGLLSDGQEIKIKKITSKTDIKHENVICFEHLNRKIVKSVKGIPGDSFNIIDNRLFINNKYVVDVKSDIMQVFVDQFSGVVPENNYIVLGTTDESLDSRVFGLILRDSIIGIINND